MADKIFRISVYLLLTVFALGLLKFVPFVHLIGFLAAPFCFLAQIVVIIRAFIKGEKTAKFKLMVFIVLLILACCRVWFPHYGSHAHILFHEPHFH